MAYRACAGIDVTEDTLATNLIGAVGPGGSFRGQKQTMDHLAEQFFPKLSDRSERRVAGCRWKETRDMAKEEAKLILREHEPIPL